MNSVTLLMKIAITAATSIFCNDDIKSRDSVVFSITSHGRLLGELLFVTLKDVVGNCLYACMQHASCLTISYQQSSKICNLMADVLKKGVLKYSAKFHRKTPALKSLFHKVAGLIKKRLQYRCFPVKFAKMLRTSNLKNISLGGGSR